MRPFDGRMRPGRRAARMRSFAHRPRRPERRFPARNRLYAVDAGSVCRILIGTPAVLPRGRVRGFEVVVVVEEGARAYEHQGRRTGRQAEVQQDRQQRSQRTPYDSKTAEFQLFAQRHEMVEHQGVNRTRARRAIAGEPASEEIRNNHSVMTGQGRDGADRHLRRCRRHGASGPQVPRPLRNTRVGTPPMSRKCTRNSGRPPTVCTALRRASLWPAARAR